MNICFKLSTAIWGGNCKGTFPKRVRGGGDFPSPPPAHVPKLPGR